jgi:hypothetical protein
MRRSALCLFALGITLALAPCSAQAAQQQPDSPQNQMPMRGGMGPRMGGERVFGTVPRKTAANPT